MFRRAGFNVSNASTSTDKEKKKSEIKDKKSEKEKLKEEKKLEKGQLAKKSVERPVLVPVIKLEDEKKYEKEKLKVEKKIEKEKHAKKSVERVKVETDRKVLDRPSGSTSREEKTSKDSKKVEKSTVLSLLSKRGSDSQTDKFLLQAKVDFLELWESKKQKALAATIDDFDRVRTIGTGSFGRVILFQHKQTKQYVVTKIMEKQRIVKMKQVEHTLNEKKILQCIKHPFVVHLEYCFKDNENLFLVLPFIQGGDLFSLLRKFRKFTEDITRFYGAQVTIALEYLHHLGLVYRDLKPENIVIDGYGNVRITDFGFCKMVNKGRTWTLCGTPDYIAPELILTKGHGLAADWWSLGVLLFEMAAGYTPFYSSNQMQIYENIVAGKVKYPPGFSSDLKFLIGNLLQPDLSRRFGNLKNGVADIKKHKWFKNLDWDAVLQCKISPPIKPRNKGPGDTSNFDKYEELPIKVSNTPKYAKEFEDF